MLRRLYLFLVIVRLYFALSPSYLHPDENFQGPEVIAGESSDLGFLCSDEMALSSEVLKRKFSSLDGCMSLNEFGAELVIIWSHTLRWIISAVRNFLPT